MMMSEVGEGMGRLGEGKRTRKRGRCMYVDIYSSNDFACAVAMVTVTVTVPVTLTVTTTRQ